MKMKSPNSNSDCRQASVASLLMAATLLVSACGCSNNHVVRGPIEVSYEVQLSETTKSSGSRTCREIQIRDQCVLLVAADGKGGSVIPVSKLNSLSWRRE